MSLVAALAVSWSLVACGRPTIIAPLVPDDHAAVDVLARAATMSDFSALAEEQGLDFACGEGGLPPGWRACLLDDRGIVAVIGFDVAGIEAVLEGPDGHRLTIPIDDPQIHGSAFPIGVVVLELRRAGKPIGSISMRR